MIKICKTINKKFTKNFENLLKIKKKKFFKNYIKKTGPEGLSNHRKIINPRRVFEPPTPWLRAKCSSQAEL